MVEILVYQKKETGVVRRRERRRRRDRRCRRDRPSLAADPDADGGTNCGRAAGSYRSTTSAHAASHHTNGQKKKGQRDPHRPYPAPQLQTVMTQEMSKQVPVPGMTQLVCLCPLQCCRSRRESRRFCSSTDRGKCPVSAPSAMMQEGRARSGLSHRVRR